MISGVLIVASVIVFVLAWRKAYRQAKQDERLAALRGDGESRLTRWDHD